MSFDFLSIYSADGWNSRASIGEDETRYLRETRSFRIRVFCGRGSSVSGMRIRGEFRLGSQRNCFLVGFFGDCLAGFRDRKPDGFAALFQAIKIKPVKDPVCLLQGDFCELTLADRRVVAKRAGQQESGFVKQVMESTVFLLFRGQTLRSQSRPGPVGIGSGYFVYRGYRGYSDYAGDSGYRDLLGPFAGPASCSLCGGLCEQRRRGFAGGKWLGSSLSVRPSISSANPRESI